jgi:hypothetical protein
MRIQSLLLLSAANVKPMQLYVFAMNNKASSAFNTPKKCSYRFPRFPNLQSRTAGD